MQVCYNTHRGIVPHHKAPVKPPVSITKEISCLTTTPSITINLSSITSISPSTHSSMITTYYLLPPEQTTVLWVLVLELALQYWWLLPTSLPKKGIFLLICRLKPSTLHWRDKLWILMLLLLYCWFIRYFLPTRGYSPNITSSYWSRIGGIGFVHFYSCLGFLCYVEDCWWCLLWCL